MTRLSPCGGYDVYSLRVEDRMAGIGGQQWWEIRETSRLWQNEPPSVGGTLSPGRRRNKRAYTAVQPPKTTTETRPKARSKPQPKRKAQLDPPPPLPAPAPAPAPDPSPDPAPAPTKSFRRKKQVVETAAKPSDVKPLTYRRRKANLHEAAPPSRDSRTRPRAFPSSEYSRQFQWSPTRSKTVATSTSEAPTVRVFSSSRDKQSTDTSEQKSNSAKTVVAAPNHPPPAKSMKREFLTEYDNQFDWPEGMPVDTSARPTRDAPTMVHEDALPPPIEPAAVPFPQTEYRSAFTMPVPLFPPSVAAPPAAESTVADPPFATRRVMVGDPGQTMKQIHEYNPNSGVDDNDNDNHRDATVVGDSAHHFTSGEGDELHSPEDCEDYEDDEDDDGMFDDNDGHEDTYNSSDNRQIPLQGTMHSRGFDLELPRETVPAPAPVARPPARTTANSFPTRISPETPPSELAEQVLENWTPEAGVGPTNATFASTEYSERFRNPAIWFDAPVGSHRTVPAIRRQDNSNDAVRMAAFADLRRRASEFKSRNRQCNIAELLTSLETSQRDLLARASRGQPVADGTFDLAEQTLSRARARAGFM